MEDPLYDDEYNDAGDYSSSDESDEDYDDFN